MAMDGEKCSNSKWRHIKKPFRAKVIQTRKEFKFLNVPTQKKCAILACWKEFYLQKSFIILWCLPKRCFGLPQDRSLNCKIELSCFLRRYAPIVKTTKNVKEENKLNFLMSSDTMWLTRRLFPARLASLLLLFLIGALNFALWQVVFFEHIDGDHFILGILWIFQS